MKTVKLLIGIISIILSLLLLFQSCITGLSNTIQSTSSTESTGMLLAICLFLAGIISIATKNSSGNGSFIAAGFYITGGIVTFLLAGEYSDTYIWTAISIIFGAIFVIGDTKKINTTKRSTKI